MLRGSNVSIINITRLFSKPIHTIFVNQFSFHLTTQNNLHNQPMLVNEYFQVITTITNGFDIALQNVGLSITVPENLRNKGIAVILELNPNMVSLTFPLQ